MNKLSTKERAAILSLLCEGTSISATCRLTGAAKNTVQKLLLEVGEACAVYHDNAMWDLQATRIECDEIWAFIGKKEKNVPVPLRGTGALGDCYVWVAMDPDSKLVPCWQVGTRSTENAYVFMANLAKRLAHPHPQISTDAYFAYTTVIDAVFGRKVGYGQVVKTYSAPEKSKEAARRYSPSKVVSVQKTAVRGNPDPKLISTSLIERQNLTIRMQNRRFTRLTNAFSKKLANHMAAVSLHFMHYNFCRIHKSLRVTPAMEAGITDHVWDMEEVVSMAATYRPDPLQEIDPK